MHNAIYMPGIYNIDINRDRDRYRKKESFLSDNTKNILKNFGYGYIAGMAGIVTSHPFDTLKTNYQQTGKLIYKNLGGNLQLYKGVIPPLIGVGFEKAVVFGIYESTRKYTNSDILSGGLSGLGAGFIVTPFERVKILLQTQQRITSLRNINLFQGLSATFSREVPGFAIYFYSYNKMKKEDDTIIHNFMKGGASGMFAWIFIYPQDRIKTYIQASKDKKISFIDAMKTINKTGITTFYKGFHLALLRAIPLHATAFTTFEYLKYKF